MTPEMLGTIGIYASAALSTAGFATFAATARFWLSRGGWHVFWFMLVLTWVLDLAAIRVVFGDAPWFAWLRAATFAIGMPLVVGWRSWIIFDLQVLHRHHEPKAYGKTDSHSEETHAA